MKEEYRGWLIESRRIGIKGEFFAEAALFDEEDRVLDFCQTQRMSGPGAKQNALEEVKRRIDSSAALQAAAAGEDGEG